MARKNLLFILTIVIVLTASVANAQKKKFNLKKLNIGEKIGDMTGNLMTGKTDVLAPAVAKVGYYCGIYPMEAKTSETKYMPEGTVEGDYIVSVTFFKNDGVGLLKIKGDVFYNGEPMEYVGLGSYLYASKSPLTGSPEITVQTELGDKAKLVIDPIVSIELLSINGETSLPVLDLAEDLEIEINNPEGSENTQIKVSLLSKTMGAQFLNHFATFPSGEVGVRKITIPKAALANPEVAGQLNVGNYNKGENLLIVERVKVIENDKIDERSDKSKLSSAEYTSIASSSIPVIVKGKQDGGLNVALKITGKTAAQAGFDIYKPNATTGIPLSQASSFGLVSHMITSKTFEQETETSEYSYKIGDTRYTRTTTTTTTFEFPQLPDARWELVMEEVHNRVIKLLNEIYGINIAPLEKITSTTQYPDLFATSEKNTKEKVQLVYKNTLRTDPQGLFEMFANLSSNPTSDVPVVNMMKEAEVDGLISMSLTYQVGGDKKGKLILIPQLRVSITGRDENNNNKQGTYFTGLFTTPGANYNIEAVKTSDAALLQACSVDELIGALKDGISIMKAKEAELGYDAIYSIGQ